ncbi:MAG: efflux RND transporter permease subunit [Pseudomonadota bacterium]
MPNRFVTSFFANVHLLGLAIALIVVAGVSAYLNLPRIEDPRITTRNANITTFLPGGSAARIEALITKPLEERLEEIDEIKTIESTSRDGVSSISIELDDGIGADTNETVFAKVRDKLSDAEGALPSEATKPAFDDKRGAVAFTLVASLRANGHPSSIGMLSRLADELAARLRQLPGSELVRVYGEADEEVLISIDPIALSTLGLTARDIAGVVREADVKAPAGAIRAPTQTLTLEVTGELSSLARIREVPISESTAGGVITLGDIAQVERRWRTPRDTVVLLDASSGESPGDAVLVAARVQGNANAEQWTAVARETLGSFQAELGPGIQLDAVFDQTQYTRARLDQLGIDLLAGSALVVIVVFFLMGWRAALIIATALPLSAAATLFGLSLFGQQIHQMTIFGLIVAIGLLIDNAIVVTDDVRKRLANGATRPQAMAATSAHLFNPLLASTLTTVLGFMPIFLLPGNVGDFVGPIAISVVLALIASFAISMTIICALAAHLVPIPRTHTPSGRDRSFAFLARIVQPLLYQLVSRPWLGVLIALLLPIAGFSVASSLPQQFFPSADRNQFEIEIVLDENASIAATRSAVKRADGRLKQLTGVATAHWSVGESFPSVYYNVIMNQEKRPAYAQGIVTTDSPADAERLISKAQDALSVLLPEARVVVSAFGQGPPFDAPIVYRLLGPDPKTLGELGDELRRIMHEHPAITVTQSSVTNNGRKLWFVPHEDEARLAGLSGRELAAQLQTNLDGATSGSVLEDLEALAVRIRLGDHVRQSPRDVANMNFARGSDGQWVPATALGEFELRPALSQVTRRNGERVNKVLGFVKPSALPIQVNNELQNAINATGFTLPPGYRLETGGESEEQGQAVAKLATYVPVLVVLMVATLVLSFQSVALAGIVLGVGALALGLGLLALKASGFALGFNPMLGSLGLIGVAINGSIVVLAVLVAKRKTLAGDPHAIVNETLAASRHIVATTLTTVGGFVPLILSGGTFWPPLAVVIAGGVGLSLVLSLLLTPTLFHWWVRKRPAATSAQTSQAAALSTTVPVTR